MEWKQFRRTERTRVRRAGLLIVVLVALLFGFNTAHATHNALPGVFDSEFYTVTEGGTLSIVIRRYGATLPPQNFPITVNIINQNGLPMQGPTSVEWAAGDNAAKILTFTVPQNTFSTGTNFGQIEAHLGNHKVGITNVDVIDDDASVRLGAAAFTVDETAGTAAVTAMRQGGTAGVLSVDYVITGGTATANSDYTASSGTLVWGNGDSAVKTIPITIIADGINEPNETVNVALTAIRAGAGADVVTLGTPTAAVLTVNDVPPSTLEFSGSNFTGDEGSNVVVTVNRSASSSGAVSVDYATVDASASLVATSSDYTPTNGTLNWASGESGPKTFTVTLLTDQLTEAAETFQVTLTNPGGGAVLGALSSATVTINANTFNNSPPFANDGEASTPEDQRGSIDLAALELAGDADGDFFVSDIPASPAHGTVTFSGHVIEYTPARDFFGTDEFTYQVSDMQGATASAKITVTVLARNDAPSIAVPTLTRTTAIDTPVNIDVSENISDPDGDVLVISDVLNGPQSGAVVWTGYAFTYTPNSGFTGDDQFDYVIFDQTESSNSTAQGRIVVRVGRATNNPPTAQNLETNATAGSSVVINLKNAVSDLDQDTLVISAPEKTEHGSVSLDQLTLTYTPDAGFVGNDTFTYTVTDGFSDPVTATIVVRVDGVTPQSHQINIRISGDATRVARLNSSVELRISAVDENGVPLSGLGVSWTAADRAARSTPTFSSQDTVTDSNGAAAAVLVTSNIPSTYDVTVTVTSPETNSSADAAFVVGAGLYALARPNTPEGAMASYLDWVCPRLQDASDTLSEDAQNLLQRCDEIMNAATDDNDTQILTTLRALAPEEAAAQARTGNSFAQAQLGNIGARLAALRGGARGFALSGLAFNIKGDVVPGSVLAELFEPGARGGAAGADDNLAAPKWSAFVSGNVGGGEKNRTAQEEGFDFQTRGLTGGADYRYSSDVVFGAALGYARSDVDVAANGGALDASGVNLALYGTWYRTQSMYVDGVLNYARNSYEQKRNIAYTVGTTTINRTARGNPDGRLLALSLGGGYEYAFKNGASVDGSLRLRYLDTTIDAYTETGAAELNLHINDQNTRLFSSSLGGRASWPLSFKWGVLIPQFDLSWEHDFDGGAHTIKGNFVNEQFQNQFTFKTEDADRDYFQSGLGASAVFPGGNTGFVQYQTTLGRDHFREWNVAFGVRAELP